MQNTLFVGGVTGSGKTTICRKLAELLGGRGNIVHVGGIACALASASALASDSIEQASIHALDQCQNLVVEHIAKLQHREPTDAIFILDGHFVLGGIGRPPYCLPTWFFTGLRVSILALCAPPVSEIRARINSDSSRFRPAAVVQSLEHYVAVETEHAKTIAQQCGLPLTIIQNDGKVELDLLIRQLGLTALSRG